MDAIGIGRSPDPTGRAVGSVSSTTLLVELHPEPESALCDGQQALLLEELPHYLQDVQLVRETYEKRRALADKRVLPVQEDPAA